MIAQARDLTPELLDEKRANMQRVMFEQRSLDDVRKTDWAIKREQKKERS